MTNYEESDKTVNEEKYDFGLKKCEWLGGCEYIAKYPRSNPKYCTFHWDRIVRTLK